MPLTWQQIKTAFESANPTLKAAQLNIDESRAAEITAYLRPNPDFSLAADGLQVSRNGGVWRPFSGILETPAVSYLHERRHKRELRFQSARESTEVAASTYLDQERNLTFNLRNAFVQTLQAKAVLENAGQNIDYWDHPDEGESVNTLNANSSHESILPPKDGFVFQDREKFPASFGADLKPELAAFLADSQVPWGVGAGSESITKPSRAGTWSRPRTG